MSSVDRPQRAGRFRGRVDSPVRVDEPAAVERGPLTAWSFDGQRLSDLALEYGPRYRSAQPFPHIVVDGLFPDALLAEVSDTFPPPEHGGWMRLQYEFQTKLQWIDAQATPAAMEAFIALMQSSGFLSFLEELTGVPGLVGDPHLFHAGPHQSEPGGYLKVHTDQLFQQRLWLYRRVNVIVYLNRGWDPAWGGHLQLWDEAMTTCVREIEPIFNRMIVFDSSTASYHGHPDPTTSPPGVNRQSVALYYYTSPENPATPPTGHDRSHFVEIDPRWQRVLTAVTPPMVKRRVSGLRSRMR